MLVNDQTFRFYLSLPRSVTLPTRAKTMMISGDSRVIQSTEKSAESIRPFLRDVATETQSVNWNEERGDFREAHRRGSPIFPPRPKSISAVVRRRSPKKSVLRM